MRRALALAVLVIAFASLVPAGATAQRSLAGFGLDSAGQATVLVPTTKAEAPVVIRLTAAGTLDPSFSGDGILRPPLAGHAVRLAVEPGGGVIVGGTRGRKVVLLRYRADGSRDRSFGDRGIALVTYGGPIEGVMIQPRGQVIALGTSSCTPSHCGFIYRNLDVLRYSPRGKRLHWYRLSKEAWYLHAAAMDPRGGFLIAGGVSDLGYETYDRFRPSGAFAGAVRQDVELKVGNGESSEDVEPGVSGLVLEGNGRFVLASDIASELWRRNPNGSADPSFGDGGRAVCRSSGEQDGPFGAFPPFSALVRAPDGKLLAAGGDGDCWLVRYLADGRPDPSFGSGGAALADSRMPPLQGLAVLPDGSVIAAGWDPGSKSVRLVRYSADGVGDPSYGVEGLGSVAVDPTG